ncbi:OLC1v1014225C1 [Oldenlandia corymbosa var. corymbosa]|uniref:OLC1v1014225C1 n=1 Tax=Oldenlandia corymbosa var. corymbosa TaxID=529605 RepID=A0AAV1E0A5_OLDCO|nr:OLC1v1014225C1 [Oldenlandia corymbosa var. corymbosa]
MEEGDESTRVKGVVIITLPPADNPSLGKTITAFAITDEDDSQLPHQYHYHGQVEPPQPPSRPLDNQNSQAQGNFSLKRLLFGSPISVLLIISMYMIGLYSWASFTQENFFELRDDVDDNRKSNTIILPLYSKLGFRGSGSSQSDFELKLGRYVDSNDLRLGRYSNSRFPMDTLLSDPMSQRKTKTVVSAASKVDASTVFPINGNIFPDGLYFTYVLVGTPPRPYFLDIDTGSDLTWIQCDAPCTSCAKGAHPFYKPTTSKIVHSNDAYCAETQKNPNTKCEAENCDQCDYEIEYADHSSSIGVLARDKFYLSSSNGSIINANFVFGCAYDQQGSLLNSLVKTDGIFGLSKGKVSLPSQLATQGNIKHVVAHCLAAEAGRGGYMFLGNDLVPHQHMTWVPMLDSTSLNAYHTEVTRFSYGGNVLRSGVKSSRLIVFDSGSSYTYFPKEAYADLVAKIEGISGENLIRDASDGTLPLCWRTTFEIRSISDIGHIFKPLDIHFRNKWWVIPTKLQIPPQGYLVITKKGNVCLGILDGSKVHDGSTVILGGKFNSDIR